MYLEQPNIVDVKETEGVRVVGEEYLTQVAQNIRKEIDRGSRSGGREKKGCMEHGSPHENDNRYSCQRRAKTCPQIHVLSHEVIPAVRVKGNEMMA